MREWWEWREEREEGCVRHFIWPIEWNDLKEQLPWLEWPHLHTQVAKLIVRHSTGHRRKDSPRKSRFNCTLHMNEWYILEWCTMRMHLSCSCCSRCFKECAPLKGPFIVSCCVVHSVVSAMVSKRLPMTRDFPPIVCVLNTSIDEKDDNSCSLTIRMQRHSQWMTDASSVKSRLLCTLISFALSFSVLHILTVY